ncbi:hypothetical protein WI664_07655 [Vibrio cholerae]
MKKHLPSDRRRVSSSSYRSDGGTECDCGRTRAFSWGKNAEDAVHNAVVLEEISAMALATRSLNSGIKIQPELSDKHYLRKHGANAYYGQR